MSVCSLPQVKALFNFLLGVSSGWDLDDINLTQSTELCRRYLEDYYKKVEHGKEQTLANWTFVACLPLWSDRHSLCPVIYDFNLKMLDNADGASICLVLPQLLRSLV